MKIGEKDRIFVLTGAGISAESGIRTFRDSNGLWENHRVEEVASPEGWNANPGLVWKFYSERRQQAALCTPNAAHVALAAFEKRFGDRFFLCTQNVDDLHERAGSKRLLHMHGELFVSRCESWDDPESPYHPVGEGCARRVPFRDDALYFDGIPRCECGRAIRPHICWFGEIPFEGHRTKRELRDTTVFVTIGSSGVVYPAAGFVRASKFVGARTIYVGPERPANAEEFDEILLGTATEVVPSLFE